MCGKKSGTSMSDVLDSFLEADDSIEQLSDEEVVYQIFTSGADFDVDGLVKRFDRGDIFRPEFQRNFVWTIRQASRFVESILLGLPIPSVFLYREERTQKLLIVDGLQRLTTVHAYKKGRLPGSPHVFRLQGVKMRFEGKSLDELAPEDQRRFEDAIIHAMIIQQVSPDDNSSVYHIFDRLNSNGTPLQPQEIRAAIFHGPYQSMLEKLNQDENWRQIFGPINRRGKDQELILRFLALHFFRFVYQKPMKSFLNMYMKKFRDIPDPVRIHHEGVFKGTIARIYQSVGSRAFRSTRTLNVAFFDAFMVAVAERPEATIEHIQEAHSCLISNDEFLRATSDATSDERVVERRINIAMDTLDAAIKGH